MKTIVYSKQAQKALQYMPKSMARNIVLKINAYAENPQAQANNIIRLAGSAYYRMRVGDWRVIFDEDGMILTILKIAVRGEVYK